MPVLVIADLHLDFWLGAGRDPLAGIDPPTWASLDAVIIAGDLANKPKVRWPHMIRHLGRYMATQLIHVLPGNHDYYDHALDREDRLVAICADAGAKFSQKVEITVADTRFLCCTLWSDFALYGDPVRAMRIAQNDLNDYSYIRLATAGHRRIRPSDVAYIHTDHRRWLEERLAAPFGGRTVVATHHCPHPDLISATNNLINPAYGSDLAAIIKQHRPDAWLFGHTHQHVEVDVGRTRVCNVSLGYPGEVGPGDEAGILWRGLIQTGSLP